MSVASPSNFKSLNPENVELMAISLRKHHGVDTAGMTNEEIAERYHAQDAAARAESARRAAERRRQQELERQAELQRREQKKRVAAVQRARMQLATTGQDTASLDDEEVLRLADALAEREWQERTAQQRLSQVSRLYLAARVLALLDDHLSLDLTAHAGWKAAHEKLMPLLGEGLIIPLLGRRGTGKSQLAVVAIRAECDRLRSCRYFTRDGLNTEIYRRDFKERAAFLDELARVHFLVIDEVHQTPNGTADFNNLTSLVDRRYGGSSNGGLTTILIANQTREEFAAHVGDSIVSRQGERGESIYFDHESFRKLGAWRSGRAG